MLTPQRSSSETRSFSSTTAERSKATPPPGDDAFFDRCAGGVQGVFDARLLFFHLDFGRRTDVDHRDAADQLSQALLELLAVVVGSGLIGLGADLLDAAFEIGLLAGAIDDGGVVLVDDDSFGAAEIAAERCCRA